ncbi:phage tail domain-containing protein [Lysinibacillus sp. NPDC093712]|uniref:phage tail domain-containing protein n=1 Tax=Lysinibacillus sp. NPDC093712 TaxID=3390579 RepID=UPI003D0049AE
MLQSMHFTYNGKSSRDMGVTLVHEGGLYKDIFLPNRTLKEVKVNGKGRPYFKGVDINPLSFSLSFFIEEWEDRNNLRAISRWLFQDYYKPLILDFSTEMIFYAIIEGNSELIHNGCQEGYVTLNVRCDTYHTYSPLIPNYLEVRDSLSEEFFNEGDLDIRPQLKITKIGDGDISIKNELNEQEFILKGLYNNEVVLVNCENEEIMSSFQKSLNRYLFDNHNDVWLDFEAQTSAKFTFKGNFDCEFYYEYKYLNADRPIYDY